MRKIAPGEPVGRYLAHEVGQLAGVTGDRVGQWARRGYIRSSRSNGPPRIYSWQDAAEAMAVHELIDRGVRLATIRGTIEALREDFGDWPLQAADLFLPDRPDAGPQHQLAYRRGGRRLYDAAKALNQTLLNLGDMRAIALDLRRGGWAARQLPDLRSIEVDPERMSGRPAIKGRRMIVEDVVQIAREPDGRRLLRSDYELTDRQIDDALRWWSTVESFEQAA